MGAKDRLLTDLEIIAGSGKVGAIFPIEHKGELFELLVEQDDKSFKAGRREGGREVVKWVEAHSQWLEFLKMSTNMCGISLDGKEWQAYLKKKGIK